MTTSDQRKMENNKLKDIGEAIVGATLIAFHLVLGPALRGWRVRWGATQEERKRTFPGDDLIPHPKWAYTHAVTIRAPAARVWPWVVQIGQGRGGFYSYELLENLVGCDIHNADKIIPEFQELEVGDSIHLHPKAPPLPVIGIEPGRFLLLGSPPDYNDPEAKYAGATWLFYLREIRKDAVRLISHGRNDYGPKVGFATKLWFSSALMEPLVFVMDRKMLWGIKQRAEAAFGNQQEKGVKA